MKKLLLGVGIGVAETLILVAIVLFWGGPFRAAPVNCATCRGDLHLADERPATQQEGNSVTVQSYHRGRTRVEVVHIGSESLIEVWRGDKLMHRRGMFSDDGWGGFGVVDVALSPDGGRVAYQCDSSGGHQPYRSPVTVVDVAAGKTLDIEDVLIARGIKDKCPHTWEANLPLKWKDNVTLLIPVCGYQGDMGDEILSVRVGP